jgi:hypothetical protein
MKTVSPAVAAALSMVALSQSANANLIANGDFQAGYAFFGSDYTFVGQDADPVSGSGGSTLVDSGTFVVTANANNWHPNYDSDGDHTTGDGKMLVANGTDNAGAEVWRQFVFVGGVPRGGERVFEFTFWARTVYPDSPPLLRLTVNGSAVGESAFVLTDPVSQWTKFSVAFLFSTPVGARGDGFNLALVNENLNVFGNDFAIDDLSLIEVPGPGGVAAMMVGTGMMMRRRRVA